MGFGGQGYHFLHKYSLTDGYCRLCFCAFFEIHEFHIYQVYLLSMQD